MEISLNNENEKNSIVRSEEEEKLLKNFLFSESLMPKCLNDIVIIYINKKRKKII